MRTIAIAINKGGVGKATLAKHLAEAAAAGGHNAMLLDMDTQQNSTSWGKRRNQQQANPLPVVRFVTENDLPEELGRASGCRSAIEHECHSIAEACARPGELLVREFPTA